MAIIKPFRAIRPAKDKAAQLASRSYVDYSALERSAILDGNPFSFLHIIDPGHNTSQKISGLERLRKIRQKYQQFLEDRILIRDQNASFYLYSTQMGDFECCGLFCATSVEDYRNNVIKKHEDTLKRRENLFAVYLKNVGFNAEPVLMTYPHDPTIAHILNKEREKEPLYHFTTADGTTHTLWAIADDLTIEQLQSAFGSMASLYIADGHHRSASSVLLADKHQKEKSSNVNAPSNYFMSYLIPESEIRIGGFIRMVKDLNGLDHQGFMSALERDYHITDHGDHLSPPIRKHQFSMYLEGHFYSLLFRDSGNMAANILDSLDTQLLYRTVLEPILGIKDLRNDERIKYVFQKSVMEGMKSEVDSGDFRVSFGMLPIGIEEIKKIADAGLVMPPKSTYIEPKLRSGLTIYEL
ncbi:MAG: DUF1015 domain-containing protein [Sediminicola sp.]|tara:strand:- start:167272 stop:168504 length:1233 start_codon:yes stop_codon:yes gene_type:complete